LEKPFILKFSITSRLGLLKTALKALFDIKLQTPNPLLVSNNSTQILQTLNKVLYFYGRLLWFMYRKVGCMVLFNNWFRIHYGLTVFFEKELRK